LTEQLPDIDPDILTRAEAALTALSSQYPVWLENDLAAMRTLLQVARHRPDDRQDLWRELAAIAHNVKGLAGTFGFSRISELAADLTAFVKGRKLDDDGNVLLRFKGGAKGVLHSSQISVGEENNLNIRVYGELGGLEWHQKEPNTLLVKWMDQPMQVCRTANGYLSDAAKAAGRTPPAHPEGYLEAFANIYKNFANAIRAKQAGKKLAKDDVANDYPKIEDGVRGMAFIEAVVASSKANAAWTKIAA